jgi:hypothetical protein
MANTTEKLSNSLGFSFNPIKTPIFAGGALAKPGTSTQSNSIRFASRGPLATLLGPTAGMLEQGFTAGQAVPALAAGRKVPVTSKNAAASFIPFNSYLGMREMLQAFNGDTPYAD